MNENNELIVWVVLSVVLFTPLSGGPRLRKWEDSGGIVGYFPIFATFEEAREKYPSGVIMSLIINDENRE